MVAGNIRGLKLLKIDVGSSVPPESPSMNPETGRFSAIYVMNVTKVAENQNGSQKSGAKWSDIMQSIFFSKDGRAHT